MFVHPPACFRYRDIAEVLQQLALRLGKSNATLRIYDPYYCEGSMVLHLRSLGFSCVYNHNEDFYKRISGTRARAAFTMQSHDRHPLPQTAISPTSTCW